MTLQEAGTDVRRHQTPPIHTPRLRLKPKAPQSGYVDRAWWPRSDDLTAELPDLLAVLSVRLGRIDRVIYHLDEWATAPAKLDTGARKVPLDGYRYQPVNTIEVLGLNRCTSLISKSWIGFPSKTNDNDSNTSVFGCGATAIWNSNVVGAVISTSSSAPTSRFIAAMICPSFRFREPCHGAACLLPEAIVSGEVPA
jgi:Family of unknown function (DUF5994)